MPKKSRKKRNSRFLSTLSLRRATQEAIETFKRSWISIHALLAESDPKRLQAQLHGTQFLSTLSLRRATNIPNFTSKVKSNFYPRSPCGERLPETAEVVPSRQFLSTLSLRRATRRGASESIEILHFYPRSPCGERPHIHAPNWRPYHYFYPRSPCGERRRGAVPVILII